MRAPIAFRMPISLVRSDTVTSIMFATPSMPTNSEMAATATVKIVKIRRKSEICFSWATDEAT